MFFRFESVGKGGTKRRKARIDARKAQSQTRRYSCTTSETQVKTGVVHACLCKLQPITAFTLVRVFFRFERVGKGRAKRRKARVDARKAQPQTRRCSSATPRIWGKPDEADAWVYKLQPVFANPFKPIKSQPSELNRLFAVRKRCLRQKTSAGKLEITRRMMRPQVISLSCSKIRSLTRLSGTRDSEPLGYFLQVISSWHRLESNQHIIS